MADDLKKDETQEQQPKPAKKAATKKAPAKKAATTGKGPARKGWDFYRGHWYKNGRRVSGKR